MTVLDVGAGADPTVPVDDRPVNVQYVGLDISADELAKAGPGAYHEHVVGDITRRDPSLLDRFDAVLSFQVFEHVKPLADAIENVHQYLRPGGVMLAQLTGTWTYSGIANLAVPPQIVKWALAKWHRRDPATVFPAHYDRCWSSALHGLLASWSRAEVVPIYISANYVNFSRPLFAAGVAYDEWARRNDHANLASHYVLRAER
jgi:SAM-dependent methyltransferase